MADDLLESTLRLAMTPGVGGVRFRSLVEHFGSAEAALKAGIGELADVPGLGRRGAEKIVRERDEIDVGGELEKTARHEVRLIAYGEADYPVALTYTAAPPPVLYVRGELRPEDARAFSIVGSRRCSLYGKDQAERFGAGLAGTGFTVISGLARGIDLHAHLGALKAGGRTIAVLGNGLSSIYPQEHTEVADRIARQGAVVSEFPMDTGPAPENFPRRNRVISGWSLGVLVVEAGRRSGALITASRAAEQGKDVFAVPGRIDSPMTRGVHRLIQDGAKLVHDLEDILSEYPDLGLDGPAEGAEAPQLPLQSRLEGDEESILGVVGQEPLTADEIAERSGLSTTAVAGALTLLELKHLIRSVPGQRYVRSRRR